MFALSSRRRRVWELGLAIFAANVASAPTCLCALVLTGVGIGLLVLSR